MKIIIDVLNLVLTVILGFFQIIWALAKGVIYLTLVFVTELIGVNVKAAILDSLIEHYKK